MKRLDDATRRILFIIFCAALMLAAVLNLGGFFTLLSYAGAVLSPVMIGFGLAFVLNIVMRMFEKRVFVFMRKKPRLSRFVRPFSIAATLLLFFGVVILLLLVVIPQVAESIKSIIAGFPAFSRRAMAFFEDILDRFEITPQRVSEILLGGQAFMTRVGNFINNNINGFLTTATSIGGSLMSGFVNALLGLFLAIYMLAQKDMIIDQCSRLGKATLSERAFDRVCRVLRLSNKAFSSFISGQFIEAVILGMLCFIGMMIFRFPHAPVVSVLVGVTALIPILGAWIGGGLSAILILITNPIKSVWFLIFFFILQQLENNLIYPRVVGKQVGLPGVWVLLAVIIGNGFMGAAGALLAVPLASVLYVILSQLVSRRLGDKKQEGEP